MPRFPAPDVDELAAVTALVIRVGLDPHQISRPEIVWSTDCTKDPILVAYLTYLSPYTDPAGRAQWSEQRLRLTPAEFASVGRSMLGTPPPAPGQATGGVLPGYAPGGVLPGDESDRPAAPRRTWVDRLWATTAIVSLLLLVSAVIIGEVQG